MLALNQAAVNNTSSTLAEIAAFTWELFRAAQAATGGLQDFYWVEFARLVDFVNTVRRDGFNGDLAQEWAEYIEWAKVQEELCQ